MLEGIFCGIGGQGVLTVSRHFGTAAARLGYGATSEERHGAAVRLGSVSAAVRLGPFSSASIPAGGADFLVALHPGEAPRHLAFLKPGGILLSDGPIDADLLPPGIRPLPVDASALSAEALGSPAFAGQILLGRLFAEFPSLFPPDRVRDALRGAPHHDPRTLDLGAETLRDPSHGSRP